MGAEQRNFPGIGRTAALSTGQQLRKPEPCAGCFMGLLPLGQQSCCICRLVQVQQFGLVWEGKGKA